MHTTISSPQKPNPSSLSNNSLSTKQEPILLSKSSPKSEALGLILTPANQAMIKESDSTRLRSLPGIKNLITLKNYPLFPKSLQLTLTKNPPIQNIKNTFMKSSYSYFQFADNANDNENSNPINNGPHKSHFLSYLIASSRSPGNIKRTYLTFIPIDMTSFFLF